MFFCEKCHFMFNITKDIKSKQVGGEINDSLNIIFEKYKTGKPLNAEDLDKITMQDIKNDSRYDNDLNVKNKAKFRSWLKQANPNFVNEEPKKQKLGVSKAYFICKSCQNTKPIEPGTVIYSRSFGTNTTVEAVDYTYTIYDNTLPRTRNYICKNSKCESHKNDDVREAVITKNNIEQIVYVCTNCVTSWIQSV